MRRITDAERRARLLWRHHLTSANRVDHPAQAAAGVVALHATDPVSVFLSALARMRQPSIAAVEDALYEERSLVRMLGMRRTMFVVPVEFASVVHAAATRAIAVRERRKLIQRISPVVPGDVDAWLAEVEDATERALVARGEAVAVELSADVPQLRTRVLMNEGKKYESYGTITTWVLALLSMQGRIVRGRPRGSWISSQYRWAPLTAWLPDGLTDIPVADAQVELVRAWLSRFGPGTEVDLRWWTGFTATEIRKALTVIQPVEVELESGATGLVLPDDLEPVPEPEAPEAVLLPALDATAMGWKERRWYFGDHGPALIDRAGNIGPTVWWRGGVVGGWTVRRDGEVAFRILEDIGEAGVAAVTAVAEMVTGWISPIRFVPRFRTPLERELTEG